MEEILAPQGTLFREAAERVAGLVLLALASPIIIASALVVMGLSERSPFVSHRRIGKNGQAFWMLKLRTMWSRTDVDPRAEGWIEYVDANPAKYGKPPCDPRVTSRFAAFCRRHSVDELPQFWHVFRGDMSLVGPRPLTRAELARHYGGRSAELLSVKPGLTGLWQVYGRSAIRFPQRSAMDLEMVQSLTPRMYLTILLRTFVTLITGEGAW